MFNAFLSRSSKLFANEYICSFFTSCIMVQSGDQLRQETHPLTFMLQNYDADKRRTHELHWQ